MKTRSNDTIEQKELVNAVNQGIESGEINGGTKWYKHIITDENELQIYLISSSNKQVVNGPDLDEVMVNATSIICACSSSSDLVLFDLENSTYYLYTFDDHGFTHKSTNAYDEESVFTDEVTPL